MPTIETASSTRQQNTTSAARSGGFARAARVVIAAGLTALLLWQSDPRAVWQAARDADWRFIVLACALVATDRVLMAYRWWTLLAPIDGSSRPEGRRDHAALGRPEGRHDEGAALAPYVRSADLQVGRDPDLQVGRDPMLGRRPPLRTVMRIFFVSTFVGTFLPASVGGDAVRAYGLSKEGVEGVEAVASVLMDRLLGVVSILIVAIAGAILARDLIDIRALFPALALLTVLSAAALTVVFSPRAAKGAARLLAFLPRGRETGTRLVTAIQRYSTLHLPMANVLLCSIAVQVLRVLQTYCLGLALGMAVPLGVYFALVPIILLIVLMPITINGIGTTQAAFVWLFGRAGVASAPAFALSVLFLSIAVVGNLPGGLLYLFGGKRAS
jgi:glycosyltransferase 2 family protein